MLINFCWNQWHVGFKQCTADNKEPENYWKIIKATT